MTMLGKRAALSCAAVLLATTGAQPALAWGKYGHQAIAWIAELDLKDKLTAKLGAAGAAAQWSRIEGLISSDPWLQNEIANDPSFHLVVPGEYHLADISTWADWVRGQDVNQNQYRDGDNVTDHSVRIPIDGSPPANPACTPKNLSEPDYYPTLAKKCADESVDHFKLLILNPAKSLDVQQRSFKYVVHLVGDIHQPLHGSSPIGYNYVSLDSIYGEHLGTIPIDPNFPHDIDDNPNMWYDLHYVWDNSIVRDFMRKFNYTTALQLATYIRSHAPAASLAIDGTARKWAEESSSKAATRIYSDPGYAAPPVCWSATAVPPGGAVCSQTTQFPLTADYTDRKMYIFRDRGYQAGIRLSCILYKVLLPAEADPCNP